MPRPSETVQPRIRSISSSVCRRVSRPRTAISEPPRRTSEKPQLTSAAPITAPAASSEQRGRRRRAPAPSHRVGARRDRAARSGPARRAAGSWPRRRPPGRRGSCRPAGRRAASGCRSGRTPPRAAPARGAVRPRCRGRGGAVGQDGGAQAVALGPGDAVDDQLLVVAADPAGRGVDAHPHETEEPVQQRRLDLHAPDAVGRHGAHGPGQQPAGDDDGAGTVGVAEPPPGERGGDQREQGDGDGQQDDASSGRRRSRWPRRSG